MADYVLGSRYCRSIRRAELAYVASERSSPEHPWRGLIRSTVISAGAIAVIRPVN